MIIYFNNELQYIDLRLLSSLPLTPPTWRDDVYSLYGDVCEWGMNSLQFLWMIIKTSKREKFDLILHKFLLNWLAHFKS